MAQHPKIQSIASIGSMILGTFGGPGRWKLHARALAEDGISARMAEQVGRSNSVVVQLSGMSQLRNRDCAWIKLLGKTPFPRLQVFKEYLSWGLQYVNRTYLGSLWSLRGCICQSLQTPMGQVGFQALYMTGLAVRSEASKVSP